MLPLIHHLKDQTVAKYIRIALHCLSSFIVPAHVFFLYRKILPLENCILLVNSKYALRFSGLLVCKR